MSALRAELEPYVVSRSEWVTAPAEALDVVREAIGSYASASIARHPSFGWAVLWSQPHGKGVAWMERWPAPMVGESS